MQMTRRRLLSASAFTVSAGSFIALPRIAEAARSCSLPTPPQTEGPFYPIHDQMDKDNDLTTIVGSKARATGQLIYVMGHVVDQNCDVIPNALVEIWQACVTGKYNHENDPNPAPVDPNFQYWGKCITDEEGRYIFRTIIPGEYPADRDWMRPPHIHFKVAKRGYHELTTQMYFAGHKLNAADKILRSLAPAERDSVIVEFQRPNSRKYEPESGVGVFNIVMRKV
jgi:protocatechuate 3,4-dioxygenase, beta subunit